jgi:hypothetical protein
MGGGQRGARSPEKPQRPVGFEGAAGRAQSPAHASRPSLRWVTAARLLAQTRENTLHAPDPPPDPGSERERSSPAPSGVRKTRTHLVCARGVAPRLLRSLALRGEHLLPTTASLARTPALRGWRGKTFVRAPCGRAARSPRAALARAPRPRRLLSGTWPGARSQRPRGGGRPSPQGH